MSEYSEFIKMLRAGSWDEGDVNYDDLLKAANIIERMEQELAKLREAIQACVDDDFNSSALMIELAALVKS